MPASPPIVQINEAQRRAVEQRLERFARDIQSPVEANREASIALYGFTLRNFDQQGGLQGGWAPLAPSTIRQKERIGKQQPLVRSGHMRAGFTSFYSRDNAGVGNEVSYSRFHHEGTARLPQRELLPRRDAVLQIGINVYGKYVERKVREANGSR
jgi:phage gpG-like protein